MEEEFDDVEVMALVFVCCFIDANFQLLGIQKKIDSADMPDEAIG